MLTEIIQQLIQTKELPLPGLIAQKKMMLFPESEYEPNPLLGKESAVLLNLYPDAKGSTNIILIQRTIHEGAAHSGQISFPGGKKESSDLHLLDTARREAKEEINLDSNLIEFIRPLSPLYIPVSNYKVFPFLTYSHELPKNLKADPFEVAQILHFDLEALFQNEIQEAKIKTSQHLSIRANAFQQDDYTIWGATAMILSELQFLVEPF